ncbi:MAG: nucleotide exchange factor GrpE [Gemmatimonadetes bacterium]|jgi:molecular chaperone GrpE|nr:nucleotide exchange factor GrpE [Gemmatimonadota bacterium]MBT4609854.1 nucleotide exchange factor GrpE [Gemmatimonadota bacterium]MBT5060470.1 nucleotide exchange factor GrpE [Gemmatimonadota bacterium]MBT5142559.1 nucleotide exchange factor GrpE [Gemmatimonadota bacterium]MBT5592086.1 nucleotide exchange factor GrpE [Gemmatimonadota bacterium]
MSSEKQILTDENDEPGAASSADDADNPQDSAATSEPDNHEAETEGSEAEQSATVDEDEDEPVDELTTAKREAAQIQDRYLRAVAELDNFRKRTVKARAETRDDTLRDVLLQIAPLLDNLRRALAQETEDAAAVRQGVEIIVTQFKEILSGYGLQEIEAMGKPFDPNEHEAMMQVPSAEHEPGIVMQEMEKGFRLRDKVVRPSRVIVSSQLDESDSSKDKSDTEEEGQE